MTHVIRDPYLQELFNKGLNANHTTYDSLLPLLPGLQPGEELKGVHDQDAERRSCIFTLTKRDRELKPQPSVSGIVLSPDKRTTFVFKLQLKFTVYCDKQALPPARA